MIVRFLGLGGRRRLLGAKDHADARHLLTSDRISRAWRADRHCDFIVRKNFHDLVEVDEGDRIGHLPIRQYAAALDRCRLRTRAILAGRQSGPSPTPVNGRSSNTAGVAWRGFSARPAAREHTELSWRRGRGRHAPGRLRRRRISVKARKRPCAILLGARRHGRGLHDRPVQRRAHCRGHPEIVKSTATAEIENLKRSFGYFGGGKAKGQDGIGSLLRRKLAGVHRKRGFIGDDLGNIAVVITRAACGKRRRKARKNLRDVSQATLLYPRLALLHATVARGSCTKPTPVRLLRG